MSLKVTDNNDLAYYADTLTTTVADPTAALVAHMADPDAHSALRDYEFGGSHKGDLAVATGVLFEYVWRDMTLFSAAYTLGTAPTGAAAIFDVFLYPPGGGNASIFNGGNKPTIAAGAAVPAIATFVPDVTDIVAGSLLRYDITQIGSTVAGANLVWRVYGR